MFARSVVAVDTLVAANRFPDYAPEPNPETKKKDVVWFAINDRPLTCFAGIWTEFKGDRGTKSKPIPGPHNVYGFLTNSPNAVVEPIHPKAIAGHPDDGRGARCLDARATAPVRGGSRQLAHDHDRLARQRHATRGPKFLSERAVYGGLRPPCAPIAVIETRPATDRTAWQ